MDETSKSVTGVLGEGDAALARSNAYGFLAKLVAGPLDVELHNQVASVPELVETLERQQGPTPSLDELAAAHYELFGLQVFPHAGVFLDTAALAGGDRVADMVERYQGWRFAGGTSDSQDHFACQLDFLAHLTGLEVHFRARGDSQNLKRVLAAERSFLDAHLLPWAVPLLSSVQAVNAALFTRVVEMAVRVAADHRAELGGTPEVLGPEVGPDASEMLANPKTSVRDIAEFLLAPSRSGCWISRADIQGLGRGSDVPRGFGSRVQLLSNLLRNAAEYDLADSLLGAIDVLLAKQAASYATIGKGLELEAFARPWLERISATRQMIDAMAQALPLAKEIEDTPQEGTTMNIKSFYDDRTSTLTFVVFDEASLDAAVIDSVLDYDAPSSSVSYQSVNEVTAFLREKNLKLHYVLETHPHADHLSGSQILKSRFPGAKIGIGDQIVVVQKTFKGVFDLPTDFATDGSQFDQLFADGEKVSAGTLEFEVISTPGHTPACVTYKFGDAIFTGDVLFMPDMGTGRCDFPAGSASDLFDSITKLYELPDETRVFVGHDYQPGGRDLEFETTIGAQKAENIQLPASRSRDEFIKFRSERDAGLNAPRLLLQSVQVNVDAGALPTANEQGMRYLRIPINAFRPEQDAPIDMEEISRK